MTVLHWLESVTDDLRFASRLLSKNGIVTATAIASLAVAVGSCVAAFSLVDALFLRTLPVPAAKRLVYLQFPNSDTGPSFGQKFSYPFFVRLREAAGPTVDLFGTSDEVRRPVTFAAATTEDVVRIRYVTGTAFSSIQVRPATGRLLTADDAIITTPRAVAVLSHGFWTRRFGRDPAVVGTLCTIGGTRVEIVGVAEEGFTGIEPGRYVDMWLPVGLYDAKGFRFTNREWNWLLVAGRLAEGVTPAGARAALQPAFSQFRREVAADRAGPAITPERIERYANTPLLLPSGATGVTALRRQFDRPLWLLTTLVALVLLIAASNVLHLALARATARQPEMAVRLALGATRGRLIRLVLVESFALSLVACTLGLGFAIVAGPGLISMLAPSATPIQLDLGVNWRVLGFLALTGTVATMVFSLVPALRASSVAPAGVLGTGRGHVSSRKSQSWPLVAIQVSFSMAMLFVAGLFLLSYGRLARTDLGFRADGVLLIKIDAPDIGDAGLARAAAFDLLDRVRALPEVSNASFSAWPLFFGGGWISSVRIPGQPVDATSPSHLPVAPGFFDTVGIRLVDGRDFERRDSDPIEPVSVVVNQAFVRRYFGRGAAIGRTYDRVGQGAAVPQEIVGVVSDARNDDPRAVPPPTVYVAMRGLGTMAVRTSRNPLALRAAIETAIRATHPGLRATQFSLQSTLVDNSVLRERLLAVLSAFFAAVGLLLASVGLYGVLTHSVVGRTREIGIRIVLGAHPRAVAAVVVRDAVVVTAFAVLAGVAAGLYLSRFVRTLLFDVQPASFTSLVLPVACLLVSAVLAAGPAARRATRMNPADTLRSD